MHFCTCESKHNCASVRRLCYRIRTYISHLFIKTRTGYDIIYIKFDLAYFRGGKIKKRNVGDRTLCHKNDISGSSQSVISGVKGKPRSRLKQLCLNS